MSSIQLPERFNIRVYGILIDDQNRILVSDEYIRGNYFTKFPGGGLELGEGTKDCLIREFMEETGLVVSINKHLYTTDFYQQSAFRSSDQIISIFYTVSCADLSGLKTSSIPFDLSETITSDPTAAGESFRWVECEAFSSETVHLPIDKIVADLLIKEIEYRRNTNLII